MFDYKSRFTKDLEEVVCEDIDPLSSAKSSKKVTTQAGLSWKVLRVNQM